MKKLLVILAGTFIGLTQTAFAADGLLLVGTQTEVLEMLSASGLQPTFPMSTSSEKLAVRLEGTTMTVYQGEAVEDILELVGDVVKGGVAFTIEVGSDLWEKLEEAVGKAVEVGQKAMEACVEIVKQGKTLIVDGVTGIVQKGKALLELQVEYLKKLIDVIKP